MQHCLKAFLIWIVWVTAYADEEDRIEAQIVDIPQNDLFRSTFTNSSRSCFCFLMSTGTKSAKSLTSLLLKKGCPTESRTMIQDFLRQISEKLRKTTCCYVLLKLSGRNEMNIPLLNVSTVLSWQQWKRSFTFIRVSQLAEQWLLVRYWSYIEFRNSLRLDFHSYDVHCGSKTRLDMPPQSLNPRVQFWLPPKLQFWLPPNFNYGSTCSNYGSPYSQAPVLTPPKLQFWLPTPIMASRALVLAPFSIHFSGLHRGMDPYLEVHPLLPRPIPQSRPVPVPSRTQSKSRDTLVDSTAKTTTSKTKKTSP